MLAGVNEGLQRCGDRLQPGRPQPPERDRDMARHVHRPPGPAGRPVPADITPQAWQWRQR